MLLFLLTFLFVAIDCGKQAAGVKGVLMCGNEPAANVKVKLYDEDRGNFSKKSKKKFYSEKNLGLDLDDLLMEGLTDENGRFYLKGFTYEYSTIDPIDGQSRAVALNTVSGKCHGRPVLIQWQA